MYIPVHACVDESVDLCVPQGSVCTQRKRKRDILFGREFRCPGEKELEKAKDGCPVWHISRLAVRTLLAPRLAAHHWRVRPRVNEAWNGKTKYRSWKL